MSNKADNKDKSNEIAPSITAMQVVEQQITGALSPDQEQELKTKYNRIRKIKVKLKDGSISVCYCKYPDRNIFALAMSKRGQNKILEAGEAILDNCFVAGDEQCKSVDSVRIASAMECYELLDFLDASSEEL